MFILSKIALVGGVAKNNYLREAIKKNSSDAGCQIIIPPEYMLSDNAAMIGWACIKKYDRKPFSDIYFKADPKLSINI